MKVLSAAIAIGIVGVAATAVAQKSPVPEHAAAVKGRQAAFLMSAASMGNMKAAAARGDVKSQAFAARAMARWAGALPGMFPPGSTAPDSEALPTIWSDRAGFEKRAADYAAAATKLAELAGANDAAGFAAQLDVVGGTCGACHKDYRKAQEKRPG